MSRRANPFNHHCLVALAVLCLASFLAHLAVMPSLPDVVPMHFGATGETDGWGPKGQMLLMDALPLMLLGLFWIVPSIDPKGRAYEKSGRIYEGFVVAFTLLMVLMTWSTEAAVFGWLPNVGLAIPVVLGALLVGLGNYLPRVRQNYTFGVKTPWALADEENWRRTQRFGGVCLIVMGLVLVAVGLVGGGTVALALAVVVIVCGVLAMYAYSYLLWRRSRS